MDTQNTFVHIRQWNSHFWLLVLANLLFTISVYGLVPFIPLKMETSGYTYDAIGLAFAAFGIGIFLTGPMVSYLIERFRRNHVCIVSILAYIFLSVLLYKAEAQETISLGLIGIGIARLLQGLCYGLTEMVVYSTLVLDTCESLYRTEASHTLSWFSRFSLALGPLFSLLVAHFWNISFVPYFSIGCAALAAIFIYMIPIPFRTPNEVVTPWSLDRFFLPRSMPLVANVVAFCIVFGLLLALPLNTSFFVWMLPGFLLALVADKHVFANANLKSEAVTALFLLLLVFLLLLTRDYQWISSYIAAMIGFSLGLLGSRFLLFFIKLSQHCQRGTVQSSFFLSWEIGIWLGIFLGYTLFNRNTQAITICGLILIAAALLYYNFILHPWYVIHRNR